MNKREFTVPETVETHFERYYSEIGAPLSSPESLNLSDRANVLYKALLSRRVEERLLSLFSEGKLYGTVHTCIGQELTGAVITEFLRDGDTIFSNHRCHGHYLSFTDDVDGLIAEIMGKQSGVCGGRGGSQHLCYDGFYSNGIQGGIVPVAAGLALAAKYKGEQDISVVFIGDGTLGEGVIYETLNIAKKWDLPLLIVLENNFYSQSTQQSETLAGHIPARPHAFGVDHYYANTWEPESLLQITEEVISQVRESSEPAFLQIDTYRLKAHSKGDDDRNKKEISKFEKMDPINIILDQAVPSVFETDSKINAAIDRAVELATSDAYPTLVSNKSPATEVEWISAQTEKKRVIRSLNQVFKDLMDSYPQIVFLGEDVKSPYGGAFKVSKDLSDLYPERVWNTPISEGAITGIGCGLALAGHIPVVEIMFGDFMALAFDQLLNHAAKFGDMYNDQAQSHLIVRTPMGGGRGYGPTHSQTLDKHFMGIPGLSVVAINALVDPATLYKAVIERDKGVFLMIENKLLYASYLKDSMPEGFTHEVSDELYPVSVIAPDASQIDLTVVAYGGMVDPILGLLKDLFVEYELAVQLVVPTRIYPFRVEPYLDVLQKTGKLLILEEGQGFAGFGAEFVSQVIEEVPQHFDTIQRLSPETCAIPASGPLEKEVLVSREKILNTILKVFSDAQD